MNADHSRLCRDTLLCKKRQKSDIGWYADTTCVQVKYLLAQGQVVPTLLHADRVTLDLIQAAVKKRNDC